MYKGRFHYFIQFVILITGLLGIVFAFECLFWHLMPDTWAAETAASDNVMDCEFSYKVSPVRPPYVNSSWQYVQACFCDLDLSPWSPKV